VSGGSFDYLYAKDAEDWVGAQCSGSAEEMIDALIEADAEDAAAETQNVLAIAKGARVRLQTLLAHMYPVWNAMEMWKSGDTSDQDFMEALAKWRGGE
jgi:transcriptional/translational regulatory protein YebC/TACO1